MTAQELYELLEKAVIYYEVVDVSEGVRWIRFDVEEEEENEE